MIPMNVTVDCRTREDLSALERLSARQDVTWRFGPRDQATEATLTLTDRAEEVPGLLESRRHGYEFVVYLGESRDVTPWAVRLADVWPLQEDDALRAVRFDRLLTWMRAKFDSTLYRGLLDAVLATAPDLVWFKHLDGTHLLVNQVFADTVHKTREDIHGKDHYSIWDAPRPAPGEEVNDCSASEEQVIREQRTGVFEEPVSTREGMKQLTTYKTPVFDPYGRIFGTVGFGHDVTHFSNMGIQLSILVESIPFPMLLTSWEGQTMRMNSAFRELAGLGEDQVETFDYRAWKHRSLTAVAARVHNESQHSTSQEYTLEVNGQEKTCKVIEVEIRDFFDNISGYFCVVHDITFQRAYEKEILREANTDILTGLYSRRYLTEYLSYIEKLPLTLLYGDMDHLKEANDRFGHAAGDAALQATARALKSTFPEGVAARLGGDEFAVVLEGAPKEEEIRRRCRELEQAVERTASLEGVPISISVGIVFSDGKTFTREELMREADRRMYQVKKEHHRGRQSIE